MDTPVLVDWGGFTSKIVSVLRRLGRALRVPGECGALPCGPWQGQKNESGLWKINEL
jgi:hypothetical protein